MSTLELKSDLYKILDKIENEDLLQVVYDFLTQEQSKEGEIWNSLSEDQKKEVKLSYQEAENADNLIKWEDLKHKY